MKVAGWKGVAALQRTRAIAEWVTFLLMAGAASTLHEDIFSTGDEADNVVQRSVEDVME